MNVHFDGPASKWTFTKDIDVEKMTTFKKVTKNEKRAKMFLSHFWKNEKLVHTHKKKLIFKEMLLLKTNFRMKGERRQMLEWKKKNEEISKVLYVLSFGLQLEMKLVQTVFISIGVKIRQAWYT